MRLPDPTAPDYSLRSVPSTSKDIKALLIDDHTLIRAGLRTILEAEGRITVVGEAGNGRDAVKLAKELKPNVIIMDVSMPVLNGIDATHMIKEDAPYSRVLGLSFSSRHDHIFAMIKAGAVGYLTKNSESDELIKAISTVANSGAYFSPLISSDIIMGISCSENRISAHLSTLTSREREVLQLTVEGKTLKEIAFILKTSDKTIQTHRSSIMRKLKIYTIAGLTKFAIRENITALE